MKLFSLVLPLFFSVAVQAAGTCPRLNGKYLGRLDNGYTIDYAISQNECTEITIKYVITAPSGAKEEGTSTALIDGIMRLSKKTDQYSYYESFAYAGDTLTGKAVSISIVDNEIRMRSTNMLMKIDTQYNLYTLTQTFDETGNLQSSKELTFIRQ